jgi:hypothetical protein
LDLVEEPSLAAKYGIRVAQIEAPAVPIRQGQLWEVTLDAAGGLNLKLVRPGEEFLPRWCAPELETRNWKLETGKSRSSVSNSSF